VICCRERCHEAFLVIEHPPCWDPYRPATSVSLSK